MDNRKTRSVYEAAGHKLGGTQNLITRETKGEITEAHEEIIVDFIADELFSGDTTNLENFLNELDKPTRNKLIQWILDLIDTIKQALTQGDKKIMTELSALERQFTDMLKQSQEELEKIKKAFEDAYRAEGKHSGTSYHISPNFAEEIDKTLNGEISTSNQVKARDFTPKYLVENGAKDLPMLITQNHIKTIVYTEAEAKKLGLRIGKNINYHGLGKDLLVKAIDNMDTPSAVYKKDADNFIIITELTDNNGNEIIVPVKINGKGVYNDVYIDENHITSVYGKKNLQNYLEKNNFEEVDIKKRNRLK